MTSPDLRHGAVAGPAPADPVPADPAAPAAVPGRLLVVLDGLLRVLGGVLTVLAAVLSAVLELLVSSLRVQGQLIGVSIALAVLVNVALAWLARWSVGRRWAVGLPWASWTAVMFLAAGATTTEGDYLVSADNWVTLPMILAGSLAFGSYAYRIILNAPRLVTPQSPSDTTGY